MATEKTVALTIQTFVDKVMSLLLNMHLSLSASLVAQRLKRLPPMRETLGREDPLEKEMVTHSSILAWRIPWTEKPGRLHSPRGPKELDTSERLHFLSLKFVKAVLPRSKFLLIL